MVGTSKESNAWSTDPSQYTWIGKIGQGAFASVWRAESVRKHDHGLQPTENDIERENSETNKNHATESKVECAIKVLNLDHVDSNLSEIRLEVQSMRLSSHPNILSCFAAFVHATDLWLVTQLMRKGSSISCLQSARKAARTKAKTTDTFPINMEKHIMYIVHETLLGLQYIHEHNGQIHRDIKAGNILIDSNGDVRIADFGVSGWLVSGGTQQEKAKTFVGTPCWMAPEVMEQINGYDYKADIWSLGITAMELAKGYAPYAKYPPMKVLILTIQEDPPSLDTYDDEDGDDDWLESFDEEFSASFRSFIDSCLQKNPLKRPTTSDLLHSKPLMQYKDSSFREHRRKAIVNEVCSLVDDVGNPASSKSVDDKSSLPSQSPISIFFSEEENSRPAGTTWVFADGSQVLSSSAKGNNASVDDILDEIDQFGIQTGGEHYSRVNETSNNETQTIHERSQAMNNSQSQEEPEGDDINAFMDEFELNTQGENFRRKAE